MVILGNQLVWYDYFSTKGDLTQIWRDFYFYNFSSFVYREMFLKDLKHWLLYIAWKYVKRALFANGILSIRIKNIVWIWKVVMYLMKMKLDLCLVKLIALFQYTVSFRFYIVIRKDAVIPCTKSFLEANLCKISAYSVTHT